MFMDFDRTISALQNITGGEKVTKKPDARTAKTSAKEAAVEKKDVDETNKTPFIDLVHENSNWQAKDREKNKTLVECETKADALKEAMKIAKKLHAELVIHNKDGKISDRRSYGNDPKGNG